jgi:protein-S-isoprenylcysteine O-methyltransferase Ste14
MERAPARLLYLAAGIFFLVVPFPVTIVVPALITGWHFGEPLLSLPATRGLGAVMVLIGLFLLCESIVRFANVGRGTPSPLMPTAALVVTGGYRFVRNPMYIGALSAILGQACLFGNNIVLIYGIIVAALFHFFVTRYERERPPRDLLARLDVARGWQDRARMILEAAEKHRREGHEGQILERPEE